MLRYLSPIAVCGFLVGCANLSQPGAQAPAAQAPAAQSCPAPIGLPEALAAQFELVADDALLAKAIGQPKEGGLCSGQVYQAKPGANLVLFRAWNSTAPNTRLGRWWTFDRPEGKISDYRRDYEICYQNSPVDMLVQCKVKPGTRIVVGPGQSMDCPNCLSYGVSPRAQVVVEYAAWKLEDCTTLNGVFSWQP